MNKLPLARNTDLVVQNAGQEILIYNLKINKAYCLNETLTAVYQACDGKTSFAELKQKTQFTDDLIYLSLDELKKQDFIEYQSEHISPFAGMSRREVIRKVGLASMIALPVVTSLIAPTSASAASGKLPLFAACTSTSECTIICQPISVGASGNFCCTSSNAIFYPGSGTFCTSSQLACNVRCCSGSGDNDPTFIGCGGGNAFACICN